MKEVKIQTLKLDTCIYNSSLRKEVEDKLIDLFNYNLTDEISSICNDFFKNKNVEIDKIELILPDITINRLTQDYLFHFREQLILYLEDYCKDKNFEEKAGIKKSKTDIIFSFLKNGYFHSNYDKKISFSELWSNQLASRKFKDFVFKFNWKTDMIKRLVYQLKDLEIANTINFLIPNEAKAILQYHKVVIDVSKKNIDTNENTNRIKEIVFQFTLIYILIKNGTGFNKKQFVLWHLSKLSAHYNVSIYNVLNILKKALSKDLIQNKYFELSQIITDLSQDFYKNSTLNIKEIEEILIKTNKTKLEMDILKDWMSGSIEIIQKNWINNSNYEYLSLGLTLLVPDYAKTILEYQDRLVTEITTKKTISQSSMKKTVWSITYIYITQPFSTFFNFKNYITYHIEKTVNQYRLDTNQLIDVLLVYYKVLSKENNQFKLLYTVLNTLLNEKGKQENLNITLDDILIYLKKDKIDNHKELIKKWISNKENYTIFENRVIKKSDIIVIDKMLKIIVPRHSDFIINYVVTIQKRFKQRPFTSISEEVFEKDVYSILFEYLLFKRSSSIFNTKMMLEKQIEELSKKYNTSFELFLDYLVVSNVFVSEITLFTMLLSLQSDLKLTQKKYDDKKVFNHDNLVKFLIEGKNETIFTDNNLQDYFFYILKYELNDFILFLFRKKINLNLKEIIFSKFKQKEKAEIKLFSKTFKLLQRLNYTITTFQDLKFLYFIFYLENNTTPFNIDINDILPVNFSKEQKTKIFDLDYKIILKKWIQLSTVFKINFLSDQKSKLLFTYLSTFKSILKLPNITTYKFEAYFWLSFFESVKKSTSTKSYFYNLTTNFKNKLNPYGINKAFFEKTIKKLEEHPTVNRAKENLNIKINNDSEIMDKIDVEKVFVEHSGLVLFYPLIPYLFEFLGFHKPHKISSEHKIRAIYILAYAATGKLEHQESDLVLEKLLCGFTIQSPLPKITLTSNEIEKTNMLLEQLILQWKVLKNTSKQGLRNTFILREGIIEKQKEYYTLNVEVKGVDVLLESYPWSLSIVKYEWMDLPIHIIWSK